MTAILHANDSAVDAPRTDGTEEQVDVKVDDLIVGRELTHSIYDNDGLLLLAEGSKITSEFRRLLKQRGMKSVRMQTDDADNVRLKADFAVSIADLGAFTLDSALTNQLDRVIDSGLMFLKNTGPSVRESVVHHGRRAYNTERAAEVKRQQEAATASIGTMLKDAVHGRDVSGAAVTSLTAQHLMNMTDDTDCVIDAAVEATRDPDLSQHCLKMATLGMAIGIEMGLDEDNCKRIGVAGLIHDWGMAKVPAEIRTSPNKLSEYDFYQIKKHPIYTAEMLERMAGIPSMVPIIVYQVHERPNGLGYPRGRTGERIHLFARILAVADTYSALTEPRPYRQPLAPYAAMECLVKLAKSRDVDPEVVRAFLKVMSLFPIGSFVALSDGSVARTIRRNGEHYTKPIVCVIQDSHGQSIETNDMAIIDLTQSDLQVVQALPTPGRDEQLLTDEILFPKRERM
ncbi:MAG TPA: HD-GYP domain-containing protein [Planctomycetaceae bacterium]|nr:HD-GYP domain-containing protein [Planctomycetaceae bacterium]